MIREPKTDRLLGLAIVGAAYSGTAVLRSGDTLMPHAYRYVRQDLFATEHSFGIACAIILFLSLAALLGTTLVRVVTLVPVTAAWVTLGVEVWRGAPGALLPGYTVVMALCAGIAFFDAVRDWTHP